MVAAIVAGDGRVVRTVCWKNPGGNGLVLALLSGLRRGGLSVEAVMESSGTYGDVLRHQLLEHGVPVYRMSGKRTHDAAEVYDGVPSLHDAKSAAIIAKLHLDGFSRPWGLLSEEKRELKAAIATMDLYREQHQRLIHSLESSLARYWPELTEHLELSSATLVALLARVGGPHDVADALEQSRGLLHGMSHGLMSEEKIEAVLQSTASSAGVRLLTPERVALMTLAAEAHRALKELKKTKLAVERLSTSGAAQRLVARGVPLDSSKRFDLPLKHPVCASKTPRLSQGTLRKLIGRKCPMKRIRHRAADARRKCFGLPRPTPPRLRACFPSPVMHEGNDRCAEPEQSNALRVPSESSLPPSLCC
jgi:hypothetical protein